MQVIAIENSTVNVEVIQALQLGASTMRAIHKNMCAPLEAARVSER
jgi:hypothetical protein